MFNKNKVHEWWETHLEIPTIFVALLFLASLLIPSAYPFSHSLKTTFSILEVILWTLFAIEYLIRVIVAPNSWRFIKRHPIDLIIIIIPFSQGIWRSIRIIALSAYFIRKARNLFLTHNMIFLFFMTPLTLCVSGVLMYQAEVNAKGTNIKNFGDSLWLAITTMSTLGYGDRYPVTTNGKIIATLTIIVGVSLIGMLTAEIAVIFIGSRAQEVIRDKENFDKVIKQIQSLEEEVRNLRNRPNEDEIKP